MNPVDAAAVEADLLRHTWFPVARIEDVDGGPRHGRILDSDLVVFRAGGRITVADGRCPHRGMAMWQGAVRDGAIECPYHGWLFDAETGGCVHVPSAPQSPPPRTARIRTYPVSEAYGHVWAALAEPVQPMPVLPGYGDPDWRYAFGIPGDVSCGMRQLTENFRDMAHFAFVHQGTMGPSVRREVPSYRVARDDWQMSWTLGTDLGGTALDGNAALANEQVLTYRITLPMAASVHTRFPDGAHRMVAQFATPVSAGLDRVRQFWVVGIDRTVEEQHGVSIEEMWEYERLIFAEDHPIVENQWPPEAPLEATAQVHAAADRFAIAYRQAYRDMLAAFVEGRL